MRNRWILPTALLTALGAGGAPAGLEQLETELRPAMVFDHGTELLQSSPSYPTNALSVSRTRMDTMPFGECLTLHVQDPGPSPYALNLQFYHTNRWSAGDAGLIAIWCRTLDTDNRHGASSFRLQYKPDYEDWRGHAETDLFLIREWTLVTLPFEVTIEASGTPQNVINLFLGGVDPHTFQLAGLRVYGFGKERQADTLPRSAVYYPGMEPDAPWRKAADARIEQLRKADGVLRITDADGKPAENADVEISLIRHRFGFGAAVRTPLLVSTNTPAAVRQQYADILTRSCSKITPTNAMKWRYYEQFKDHVPALIDWCRTHSMTLRGHLLIWPGYERLPEGYDLYKTDPAAFRRDLVRHIRKFVNLYPDAFDEWDVLNEPYTEHDFMDLLGKETVLEWFETARRANPDFLTYINDYGILSENNREHRDNYIEWVRYLIDNGAPLDGIGFQGHFRTPIPPELILERIDHFAAFGKRMQITEFDFDHPDPGLQARFFEDFVTLIYSHPQMEALINWIYLEDDFRPRAALYRADFTPTAMGRVWERLLTEEWHTELKRVTDDRGRVELCGFKGIYNVTVRHNGTTSMHKLTLGDDAACRISLPVR
jgi:GH35 family endo-1,4-beta-xylanase